MRSVLSDLLITSFSWEVRWINRSSCSTLVIRLANCQCQSSHSSQDISCQGAGGVFDWIESVGFNIIPLRALGQAAFPIRLCAPAVRPIRAAQLLDRRERQVSGKPQAALLLYLL